MPVCDHLQLLFFKVPWSRFFCPGLFIDHFTLPQRERKHFPETKKKPLPKQRKLFTATKKALYRNKEIFLLKQKTGNSKKAQKSQKNNKHSTKVSEQSIFKKDKAYSKSHLKQEEKKMINGEKEDCKAFQMGHRRQRTHQSGRLQALLRPGALMDNTNFELVAAAFDIDPGARRFRQRAQHGSRPLLSRLQDPSRRGGKARGRYRGRGRRHPQLPAPRSDKRQPSRLVCHVIREKPPFSSRETGRGD